MKNSTYKVLITFLIIVLLAACKQVELDSDRLGETAVIPPQATAAATAVSQPESSTPTLTLAAPTAAPTAAATVPPLPANNDLAIGLEDVHLYPVPHIYAGDRITFQVIPYVPENVPVENVTIHIIVDGQEAVSGQLGWGSLNSQPQAILEWGWQTGEEAGEHSVTIILDREDLIQQGDENPDNNSVTFSVPVLSAASRPPSERNATWVTTETNCCRIHVVSGTAAYRDLPDLAALVEEAVAEAAKQLDETPEQKIDIFLIDRVLGQGGYAGNAMVLSYLDRIYTGEGLYETLVHESIHVIDRQFAPQRISILAEGTAVWATGGHYKPEDLHQRSAALIRIGEYIPLTALADDFYPVQHEIGYLEAGGFVKYLVETYGWTQYRSFYSSISLEGVASPSAALDRGLQTHYGKTLPAMEAEWLNFLSQVELNEAAIQDLAASIRFFNVMRQYQTQYDPTAHFLTAWLPNPEDVMQRGNPADLTSHPSGEINITLETMLYAADTAIRAANYDRANIILDSVTRVLENDGIFLDPLATSYLNIVRTTTEMGYEPQQIQLNGSRAEILATKSSSINLDTFKMVLQGQNWVLTN